MISVKHSTIAWTGCAFTALLLGFFLGIVFGPKTYRVETDIVVEDAKRYIQQELSDDKENKNSAEQSINASEWVDPVVEVYRNDALTEENKKIVEAVKNHLDNNPDQAKVIGTSDIKLSSIFIKGGIPVQQLSAANTYYLKLKRDK